MTRRIFGSFDSNIRRIENAFGVHIYNRGSGVDAAAAVVYVNAESVLDTADGRVKAAENGPRHFA